MGWALYEVVQGVFVIWATDHLWPREMSGWSPLLLAFAKLPFVGILLARLKGLPERNALLGFHGGVLLFYLSAVPVMLLDEEHKALHIAAARGLSEEIIKTTKLHLRSVILGINQRKNARQTSRR